MKIFLYKALFLFKSHLSYIWSGLLFSYCLQQYNNTFVRCEHHHHDALYRGGPGRAHGGHHEERAAARPGEPRPPHGEAPAADAGGGLPSTLHAVRVS